MRLSRPITHVIFDLDGVLLDTERFYTQVTQEFVSRWGKTFDWSLKGKMVGRPALDSARYLVEALGLPVAPEEYLRDREVRLAELFPDSQPMPGARELTTALAAAGVAQAVATSSIRRLFDLKATRHREWFRVFDVIVLGDDPRVARGKPAPDIFLQAASDLGAEPARCVVVEDSAVGLEAAHAAGMQVVAVPDPQTAREPFASAEIVVGSLVDVTLDTLGLAGKR